MTDETEREDKRIGRVAVAFFMILVLAVCLVELDHDAVPFLSIDDPTGDVQKLLVAAMVITVTWVFLHYFGILFERITIPKVGSHAQSRSMWKLITYAIWIFVLSVVVFSLMGETGNLVLYIGLIGAALTFVLQQPLLNVLGWALISYRRMYRIGDRIAVGGAKGYVLDITTMYSELREFGEWMQGDTFTGRIVTVPNSLVFTQAVYNYTKDFPFVWDEIVNLITYESDIEVAKDYMLESAKKVVGQLMEQNYERYKRRIEIRDLHQLLLKEPELRMELSDSGVNVYVLYFCPVEQRRKIKSEITELIWSKFMADSRVGIAYPHMHLIGDLPK
ncbi:MAG: mechanosensitive ion channel family protein [Thermoplasmata archaeon]|nr:mechanosensitive ion channel family protein [Thermoplasmata archaeon]